MARHVKKNDVVEVITGDHRGQRGKVLRIITDSNLVVVEGVNMVYRHVKPSRRNPQGGRVQKEAPLHISNVLPVDPKANRAARVHFDVQSDAEGKVVRKNRMSSGGTLLDEVTRSGSR